MSVMRGFAGVELLLGLFVIVVVTGVALPIYSSISLKSAQSQAIADMTSIQMAVSEYWLEHLAYPDTLAQAAPDVVTDPWGSPYEYLRIEGSTTTFAARQRRDANFAPINTDYDLYSRGPDGMLGSPITALASRDDIVRAGNGGFTGVAEDF